MASCALSPVTLPKPCELCTATLAKTKDLRQRYKLTCPRPQLVHGRPGAQIQVCSMPEPLVLTAASWYVSFRTTPNRVKMPALPLDVLLPRKTKGDKACERPVAWYPAPWNHMVVPLLGPQEDIPTAPCSSEEVSQSYTAEKAIFFFCSCLDRFLIFN